MEFTDAIKMTGVKDENVKILNSLYTKWIFDSYVPKELYKYKIIKYLFDNNYDLGIVTELLRIGNNMNDELLNKYLDFKFLLMNYIKARYPVLINEPSKVIRIAENIIGLLEFHSYFIINMSNYSDIKYGDYDSILESDLHNYIWNKLQQMNNELFANSDILTTVTFAILRDVRESVTILYDKYKN